MRRAHRPLAILCGFFLLQLPGMAIADEGSPPPLRFRVTIAPGLSNGQGVSGRLLLVLGPAGSREPRLSVTETGMDASPVLGRDVVHFKPGDEAVIDDHAVIFPIARLADLKPGDYAVQAILHTNRDLNFPNAPGDHYSEAKTIHLDPAKGGDYAINISKTVPDETLPPDTDLVKYLKLPSKLLSDFHGRPMFLRAGIVLPRDHGRETDRRYPLRVHIGGYGERFTNVGHRMQTGSRFRESWLADDTPRMILIQLDGAGPFGDPYQINSANHGPYGDAVTRELIPHIEQTYRGIGKGYARVLDGGSTGGWVSLALQVFYPDEFNGAWSFCPDGVDFRSFQLVNIYEDKNAYINKHGFERPSARDVTGEVRYTMRHECGLENVLGKGDSWTMSGSQWGAWNATYGPRGIDGLPTPLWNPRTGEINAEVVEHWKAYDLRRVLEANWTNLGPRLRGKIHIWVGEADDYFLNNAVHQLDAFLSKAQPAYEGSITYGPGRGHCWSGISETEMMRQMANRIEASRGN